MIEEYTSGKHSFSDLSTKYNIAGVLVNSGVNKWYDHIEINNYDPKRDIYIMKSRKTTFKERLEIIK